MRGTPRPENIMRKVTRIRQMIVAIGAIVVAFVCLDGRMREVPGEDGGRRIIIATDRRIGFEEASQQARTLDYPFTLIEMRLNKDSEGEGKMSVATKVSLSKDKQQLELENYGSEPVRLNNIHKIK